MTAEQQIIEAIRACRAYNTANDAFAMDNDKEVDHAINLVKQFFDKLKEIKKISLKNSQEQKLLKFILDMELADENN